MSRQQRLIKIGLYFFNGEYRLIPNTLRDYPVWTHRFNAELEFRSNPISRALSGFERANVSRYRIEFTTELRNMYRDDAEALRVLFGKVASEVPRTIQTLPATVSGTSVTLGSGSSNDSNYYNGTYLVQGSNKARVVAYNGSTKVATVEGDTLTTNDVDVTLFPDKPTIIGISPDDNDANIIYCNMNSSSIGLNRELTIGSQVISMQLRSVERFDEIPSSLMI